MKLRSAILGLCVSAAFAAPAFADDLPAGRLTREEVMNWLQAKGYKASIKYDETAKDNYVDTTSQDVNWNIYFYSCENNRCKSIQYAAGWSDSPINDATLNTWNRTKRYIRAYHNSSASVYGEYDIDVQPGGTWENLNQTLTRWESALTNFKDLIAKGNDWATGK